MILTCFLIILKGGQLTISLGICLFVSKISWRMGPPQQSGFILASGRDIEYRFYIWDCKILPKTTKYSFKSITVTFQPLSFRDHCMFYFRGFQWASDVTESKGFDWLCGLDCACWAWAFSSSSQASSCFPWLLFTFKISFMSSHSIFCVINFQSHWCMVCYIHLHRVDLRVSWQVGQVFIQCHIQFKNWNCRQNSGLIMFC